MSRALRYAFAPMATEKEQELPLFQPFATAQNFLSGQDIDRLIAEHAPLLTEGMLGLGGTNATIRRSRVVFLGAEQKYGWLYDRLWAAAQECNRLFFCVAVAGVEANVQLARYDSANRGFYDWHTDFAGVRPLRKLSISIQLSNPEDYEGGDLELLYGTEPHKMDRSRGTFIVFPSFMLHRVTPVTRGVRWSLVSWILGRRWS
ncbi:MAG TPA: 2OG-Fe(II) oxygenase [Gammaproteobacteria bacterium]|nr:2OG-Fe(II) oxygenase [Gammaproteobacteria bacterium]